MGYVIVCGLMLGCSGSVKEPVEALVHVEGTLLLDGKPAEEIHITFIPTNPSQLRGGWALTDSSGHFTALSMPSQKEGLPAGKYKATYSKFLTPDGSILPPGQSPVAASAKESIPVSWSNPSFSGSHNSVAIPDSGTSTLELKVDTRFIAKGAPRN